MAIRSRFKWVGYGRPLRHPSAISMASGGKVTRFDCCSETGIRDKNMSNVFTMQQPNNVLENNGFRFKVLEIF